MFLSCCFALTILRGLVVAFVLLGFAFGSFSLMKKSPPPKGSS